VFIRTIGIRKVAHKSGVDQAYISRWVNCKMALGEKVCAASYQPRACSKGVTHDHPQAQEEAGNDGGEDRIR